MMGPGPTTDHFSGHADSYTRYRPSYPPHLIKYICRLVKYRGVVWDCGCGNGQLSLPMAEHFQLVCATDISARQLAEAPGHKGILYSVQPAEQTDFPDEFFDMVVVGQALHWFRHQEFFREVDRVLGRGGVFAAIGYSLMKVSPEIDQHLGKLHDEILDGYWTPERKHVDNAYAEISIPFLPIEIPHFEMEVHWTLEQMMGYLNTWSAVKLYAATCGVNPVSLVEADLQHAWGNSPTRSIRFPLFVKAGRKPL